MKMINEITKVIVKMINKAVGFLRKPTTRKSIMITLKVIINAFGQLAQNRGGRFFLGIFAIGLCNQIGWIDGCLIIVIALLIDNKAITKKVFR